MGVNDIRIAVERSARASDIMVHFFFASWELQEHGWQLPIVPDAACRIGRGGDAATALFEFDRGEERPAYLISKLSRYRHGLRGFQFSRVVVVAETLELTARLQKSVATELPIPLFSFIAKPNLMKSWSAAELLS